jgi:hypothetical protein
MIRLGSFAAGAPSVNAAAMIDALAGPLKRPRA